MARHTLASHRDKFGKTMHKWKAGTLHSGSRRGPLVTSQKQALAIAFSVSGRGKRRR